MSRLSFRLSRGVLNTTTPPIPLAYTWAAKYNLAHGPLLDMSQGVPGVPPQQRLQSALALASSSLGSFGYCPSEGELTLREAMADEMAGVYGEGTDIKPEDMSLTSGCNLAFVATIMTLADAGDEVILPVPWYFNHQMTLSMLNMVTVPLKTRPEEGFTPSVSECRALITPKTRAIVLITPNNPTGATYSPELIADFSCLAEEHGLALIIDETYRDFITPTRPPHSLFSQQSWRTHLIHLFSFSKSYGVPGHRLGLVVASPTFQTALGTILDSLQICPPRPIQLALAPILASLRPGIAETALALQARRALFTQYLPGGWRVGSIGGYFAFVRHPFPGRGSAEVCQRLAEEMGVILLPAAFFCEATVDRAEDRWIRFSVANCDDERICEVCARLERCGEVLGWQGEA
ncbi:pyridoxal phosphate-dependent transferase [Mycena rosella]|uniref:Pyridoxal phosphate-dependent transferase n=1 Tax=Mycena rosella TaxID=1033263 RepID=A0AAD7G4X8_MYCRO|nr:pyridoxal phosphate-dependent transferase [Mycena rosella]